MYSRLRFALPLAGFALLAVSACNGSGTSSPATPPAATGTTPEPRDIPASVWDADLLPGQGLIGINQVTLDVANLQATIEPVRMATAIGDSFDVDMYGYLKDSPCSDCLRVSGLRKVGGNVEVTFVAKHPFEFGPKRYDLHLFDTRGTLIPITGSGLPSGITSQIGPTALEATGPFGFVANADGYSSFFTEQVAGYIGAPAAGAAGRIFPFKTMFRDLGASSYDVGSGSFTDLQFPTGHNVMAMGETFGASATSFEIDVQGLGNQVQFLFLVDSAYGASSTRPTRLTPKYFLPEFHRKDAFEVSMEIIGGALIAGDTFSFSQATVTALDWQGEQAADPTFSPTSPADSLKLASGVASMEFFIPGVSLGAPQVKTAGVDFNGVVNPGEYWTTYEHTFSFTNAAAAAAGTYTAVVAVRDALYNAGTAYAVTREFINGTPPQIQSDLTTYAIATVSVDPPVVLYPDFDLVRNPLPADPVHHGSMVQFLIDNIVTPGSSIQSVEADPNYDGIPANFTPSVTCTLLDPDTYQAQYDWADPSYLPTPGTPLTFGVRIKDLDNDETIKLVTVQLAANVVPTAAWNGSAPTVGTQAVAVNIAAIDVALGDADGVVTATRISWGDATADFLGTLPTTHTYAGTGPFTMTVYARDNGYGPTNGPAPAPASAEGIGATRIITIAPAGPSTLWSEDFEATADGALPLNWVKLRPAAVGTTFEFGVRSGTTSPVPPVGQSKILEESGFGQVTPGDRKYASNGIITGAAQASRWGVITPEIAIPNDAFNYTLEITHWYQYNYATIGAPCGSSFGGDGASIALKSGAAGTVAATEAGVTRPLPASFTSLPPGFVPNASGANNYFLSMAGWSGTSEVWGEGTGHTTAAPVCPNAPGPYGTSKLSLNAYKGQSVRVYFFHGQMQLFSGWNGIGGSFWSSLTGYDGWRIDKVAVVQS